MSATLTGEILLTILSTVFAAGAYVFWHAHHSPEGFEARDGFHQGSDQGPRVRSRRRSRRGRTYHSAIVGPHDW
jgi:hypothetical protein